MDHYGIVLHPAGHTLSPAMYKAGFQFLDLDADFEVFDVLPEELDAFFKEIIRRPISGFSVSLPHKQTVMRYLDDIDDSATVIGAVNTIANRNGKLIGWNTDWIGIQESLRELSALDFQRMRALVLGAGGAALATVYALQEMGIRVIISNRTQQKAVGIAEKFKCETVSWEKRGHISPDIVINATSVGLEDPEHSPLDANFWQSSMVAFDIVYKPRITKFLKDAQAAGAKIITGDRMLIYQGINQFQLVTGQRVKLEIFENAVISALGG